MAEWFEEWFNTDEYIDVYRDRNNAEAKELVELILKFININPKGEVLDLACGAGRHSILFAQKGFKVTSVDLSEKLLSVAKRTAEENNVEIDFIKSDLRNFSTDKTFDLVLNLFTSFGYFEDDKENLRLFDIAFKYLKNSGYFVLDYFNKTYLENNLVKESKDNFEHCTLVQKRHIENNRVIKDIFINRNGKNIHFRESVRMFSQKELISAVEDAGFKVSNIFGGFSAEDFDDMNSQRIIIIAQK